MDFSFLSQKEIYGKGRKTTEERKGFKRRTIKRRFSKEGWVEKVLGKEILEVRNESVIKL